MLKAGLYEQVINLAINKELSSLPKSHQTTKDIDKAEASKILSQYLAGIIQKGLDFVKEGGGLANQIGLTNRILETLIEVTKEADFNELEVDKEAKLLLALLHENDPRLLLERPSLSIIRPETSIAQSSLFTGADHEPQMYSELKKEIISADQIDLLVSFIKWSGLRLIINELEEFTKNGGQLRIITTSYMGATDIKAIEELSRLANTEIKVSYDTKRTRLHAKTYIFYRDTGFSSAYVGSSNLSNVAMSSGLEWNIKLTAKDMPEIMKKINAQFATYWNSNDFEFYKEDENERLLRALKAEKKSGREGPQFLFDIHPYPYQQEILEKLQAEREVHGRFRNLVVAATGERVIIVTGCINALRSRVSGTLVNMIHALLRVIKYNYCKQCMRSKDVLALQY